MAEMAKENSRMQTFISYLSVIGVCTPMIGLLGTVIGVILSVPLAILAARSLTPHIALYHAARWLIALFRTVPDLVWALFFVVTVGLGPFAGMLTLIVDAVGFDPPALPGQGTHHFRDTISRQL